MATATPNLKQDANRSVRKLEDASNDVTHSLREVAEEAGTKVREFVHDKSEQAAELRKTAETKITEHPLSAVALAAFGGMILGALLRR